MITRLPALFHARCARPALAALAMVASTLMPATAGAALIHIDPNGLLTGATGVVVNGQMYNVEFKDGSCNTLFDNCDPATYSQPFTTEASAQLASQALLDQVFIETPLGPFDSVPSLTAGCPAPPCSPALS